MNRELLEYLFTRIRLNNVLVPLVKRWNTLKGMPSSSGSMMPSMVSGVFMLKAMKCWD